MPNTGDWTTDYADGGVPQLADVATVQRDGDQVHVTPIPDRTVSPDQSATAVASDAGGWAATVTDGEHTTSIELSPTGGVVVTSIGGAPYRLPRGDGTAGQVIATDGAGEADWTDAVSLDDADPRFLHHAEDPGALTFARYFADAGTDDWTIVAAASGTAPIARGRARASSSMAGQSIGHAGLVAVWPHALGIGEAVEVYCEQLNGSVVYPEVGLCVLDDSGGSPEKIVAAGILSGDAGARVATVDRGVVDSLSSVGTAAALLGLNAGFNLGMFVRLYREDSDTWVAEFSPDGVTWLDPVAHTDYSGFTPSHIGLFGSARSAGSPVIGSWSYCVAYNL